MAQITGLLEMQKALKDIQAKIRSLEPLNTFLKSENNSNEYTISFQGAKAAAYCEDKELVNKLVLAQKSMIVNEINSLAEKYSITLEEEDKKIMEDLYVPGRKGAVKSVKAEEQE